MSDPTVVGPLHALGGVLWTVIKPFLWGVGVLLVVRYALKLWKVKG